MCLCLSTQYLMALLTSSSCFLVRPFGPTPPFIGLPRKVAVKSSRLLYIPRRSMSSMLSLGGGGTIMSSFAPFMPFSPFWSFRWSEFPALNNGWFYAMNYFCQWILSLYTLNKSPLFGTIVSRVALSSISGRMICFKWQICSQAITMKLQNSRSYMLASKMVMIRK